MKDGEFSPGAPHFSSGGFETTRVKQQVNIHMTQRSFLLLLGVRLRLSPPGCNNPESPCPEVCPEPNSLNWRENKTHRVLVNPSGKRTGKIKR